MDDWLKLRSGLSLGPIYLLNMKNNALILGPRACFLCSAWSPQVLGLGPTGLVHGLLNAHSGANELFKSFPLNFFKKRSLPFPFPYLVLLLLLLTALHAQKR